MASPSIAKPFPCPFCRQSSVTLVGVGRRFHQYSCDHCREVWTAMAAPPERLPMRPEDLVPVTTH